MASFRGRFSKVLVALLLCDWLLGCGRDDHASRDSPEKPARTPPATAVQSPSKTNAQRQPKRQFTRQANSICRDLIPKAEAIRRRYLFEADSALQRQGFEALAREVNAALTKIKALRQPAEEKRGMRRLYRAAEAGISELERASNNPDVAEKILSGIDPFAKTALLARTYGLTSCQETAGIASSR
jgi:hypothetical protein